MTGYAGRAWRFLRTLEREFGEDRGGLVAGAMSFFALLSLVPLLIVGIAAMGYVLGSADMAFTRVFDYLGQFLAREQGEGIRMLLEGIVRGRGTAGGIGLLILLWTGSQFFVNLETAVNIAWNVKERRGYFEQRLVAIGMVVVSGALILVSSALTAATHIAERIRIPGLGWDLSRLPWVWSLAAFLLPLFITVATFTLIYKFFPNRPVKLRWAFTGGTVAGVLWEMAKLAFSWYVSRFANYNAVYGSLGTVILLAVWIYYSSMVTIIGAEVAAITGNAKRS